MLTLWRLNTHNKDLLTYPVVGWFEKSGNLSMENREMVAGNKRSLHLKSFKKNNLFSVGRNGSINFLIHKRLILLYLQHEQHRYFHTTYSLLSGHLID